MKSGREAEERGWGAGEGGAVGRAAHVDVYSSLSPSSCSEATGTLQGWGGAQGSEASLGAGPTVCKACPLHSSRCTRHSPGASSHHFSQNPGTSAISMWTL